MSYLLFDSKYLTALVDIGYRDADKRIDEIEAFLAAASGARSEPEASEVHRARGGIPHSL